VLRAKEINGMSILINKDWKKIIILLITSIILAIIVEYLFFNRTKIFLPKGELETITLDLGTVDKKGFENQGKDLVSISKESSISYKFENKYVGKILISYTSQTEFSTQIINEQKGFYGEVNEMVYDRQHSQKINIMSINIDAKSNNFKITFKGENIVIHSIEIQNKIELNGYRIAFVSATLIVVGLLLLFQKKYLVSYEKSFLLIASVAGLFYIFCTPNQTTLSLDDEIHFARSYEVLNFTSVSYSTSSDQMTRGFSFPDNYKSVRSKEEMSEQTKYLRNNDDDVVRTSYGKKYIDYNALCYVPSALGINLAKLFNAPFDIMFKLGKVANLMTYIGAMYMAIKIMPFKKPLLLFFALLPTNISLASSYSYDTIITGFLILGIALFIREYYSEKKLTSKWIAVYSLVMVFAVLPKAVYVPFLLLPLIFKKEKFNDKKSMYYFKGWMIALTIILLSSFVLPTILSPSVIGDPRVGGTSVSGQLSAIISNISDYIFVFFNNAGVQFSDKMFGISTLGQFGYIGEVTRNTYFLSLIALIILSIIKVEDEKEGTPLPMKILLAVIALGTIGLIWSALYLSFTAVGASVIEGVQGRYFLPLLFPLLLCFDMKSIRSKISSVNMNTIVSLISSYILMGTIYHLIINGYCL
jgi:uncharacterized membrane protein